MPPRHKPWIKVDADADESDKLAGLPNHSARWGWFRMMCRAKTQRRMGVFAGQAHLRQLLGTEGRYVPDMVRAGLLHAWPTDCGRCATDYAGDVTDGEIVVHDFRREQRDPTNAERQSRFRNGESNANVTPDSRALSPSPSMSPSEALPRDGYQVPDGPDEPYRTLESLTDFPVQRVEANAIRTLDALCDRRGIPAVVAALRAVAPDIETQPPAPWQVIAAARNRLEPFASTKPVTAPKGMVQDVADIRRQLDAR